MTVIELVFIELLSLFFEGAYQHSFLMAVFGNFSRMKQYTSDEEYLASPPMVHIARRAFQDTAQLVPKGFFSI